MTGVQTCALPISGIVYNAAKVQPPITSFADLWRTDLALNWARRLGYRKLEVFVRARVLNLFNRDELTNFFDSQCGTGGCIDTTILTNRTQSSLARFNPFTQQPVEGVHWRKGASYGQPTSRFGYQTPRTFDVSVGFRF